MIGPSCVTVVDGSLSGAVWAAGSIGRVTTAAAVTAATAAVVDF
jgi:hypothetical protein